MLLSQSLRGRVRKGLPVPEWISATRPPRRASRRPRHDRLRRDVGTRAADRRGQPRPGLPRHRRAGRGRRGRRRGDPRRCQPVPARTGHPGPAAGRRRAPAAVLRARPSTRTPRWSSRPARPRRSPPRCSAWSTPATRSSRSSRSTTPTPPGSQLAGGVRVPVTLRAPDFRLDVDRLRAAVTPRTRLILLNTPHNPTGAVLSDAELSAVADLAVERDLRRRHRRGLRAHDVRRRARAARDAARGCASAP